MQKTECKKCVLHTRIPGVEIGDDGICTRCASNDSGDRMRSIMSMHFTNKLNHLVEEIKASTWTYDVLVLLSGGKDSAYLLYYAKEVLGLRPLAFSCVHTLVNDTAVKNMENISQKLGVDLVKFHPSEDLYKKIMRETLLTSHLRGMDENAGCGACSFVTANTAIMTAVKLGIPAVFSGIDLDQSDTPLFLEGGQLKSDYLNGKMPNAPLYAIAEEVLGSNYQNSLYCFNEKDMLERSFPAYIGPLTFIDYDFRDNFELFERLGLSMDSYKTVFTNCSAVPFLSYFSLKHYDCLTYVKHYANEIRNGYPYFLQSNISQAYDEVKALSRETIRGLIDEYERIVRYVVDNGVDTSNATEKTKNEIFEIAATHRKIYEPEVCELFYEQVLTVNEFGRYFDIDLNGI